MANCSCDYISLDRESLSRTLDKSGSFQGLHNESWENLVSDTYYSLDNDSLRKMRLAIEALETVCTNKQYREHVLANAPEVAQHDYSPYGVCMGYDFHLQGGQPKIIEINTNAGGALIIDAAILRRKAIAITLPNRPGRLAAKRCTAVTK